MQYPYFTLLEIITVILALFIGVVIFYFLVKRWQGNNFLTALKAFVLYMVGSIIVYLIYPFPLLSKVLNSGLASFLDFLVYGIILFFIFYFITKKTLSINWKKALICFLLVVIVALPALSFFRIKIVTQITPSIPIVAEERMELEAELMTYFEEYGVSGFLLSPFVPSPPLPLALKLAGGLERATLSWPSDYFQAIGVAGR